MEEKKKKKMKATYGKLVVLVALALPQRPRVLELVNGIDCVEAGDGQRGEEEKEINNTEHFKINK